MSKVEEAPSAELVKVEDADLLLEILQGKVELEQVAISSEEMQARILEQMLAAEDVWAETPTWNAKDNVGKTFLFQSVTGVYPSKYEDKETGEGKGVFVCFQVVNEETGELGIMPTSAIRIITRLAVLWKRGKLPVSARIVKRGESAAGYDILDIEKA